MSLVKLGIQCRVPQSLDSLAAGSKKQLGVQDCQDGISRFQYVKYVFMKKHGGSSENKTLFVANIGIGWSEEIVKDIFRTFGKVQDVQIGTAVNCRFARITFSSTNGLKRAIEAGNSDECIEYLPTITQDETKKKRKREPWVTAFEEDHPSTTQLKQETEEFLTKFAELEKEEAAKRRRMEKEADADGFTLVTHRKGAKARRMGAETEATKSNFVTVGNNKSFITLQTGSTKKLATNKSKKDARNGLDDFYRFQTREKKRNQLAELREKYEQDKQKIQRLKNSRKFKPF